MYQVRTYKNQKSDTILSELIRIQMPSAPLLLNESESESRVHPSC